LGFLDPAGQVALALALLPDSNQKIGAAPALARVEMSTSIIDPTVRAWQGRVTNG